MISLITIINKISTIAFNQHPQKHTHGDHKHPQYQYLNNNFHHIILDKTSIINIPNVPASMHNIRIHIIVLIKFRTNIRIYTNLK